MKYLVFSDVHGSLSYAEKVIEIFKNGDYDRMIVLGDVLYHGPRNPLPEGHAPMKEVELLNQYADLIDGVRGNCDAEIDQALCQFDIKETQKSWMLEEREVLMSHGHIISPENHKPLVKGSVFLYGHFHIPMAEKRNGVYYCNPGSTSLPKGGFSNSYGVLSPEGFTVYDFDGNTIKSVEFKDQED